MNDYQNDLKLIGAKLIELRRSKGYTSHVMFADACKVSRIQYWRLESGKANFTIKTLTQILAIHNLTIAEFFSMMDSEKGIH